MTDVAHLLKNIRGQFLPSDVFFLNKRTVQESGLSTAGVKVEYIDISLQLDRKKELKVAPGPVTHPS